MIASALRNVLVAMIPARMPVLITGAPGIGKTSIVEQVCEEINHQVIISHPAVGDPTDVKGFPFANKGKAEFLPFGELRQAIEATEPTVWFLDDLGQATAAVQASYMQLLLARRVNGHRLPDCVTFVAATNRRVDRAGVSGILEPVKSRFGSIVELDADTDEWAMWANDNNLNPYAIAWARFKSTPFDFKPTADLTNCCMPRTLANAARILDLPLSNEIKTLAIAGAIGEGAATELMAFVRMADEMPSIDRILLDPKNVEIPKAPAVLYTLATALAARTTSTNFPQVATFLQRMVDAARGEFAVLGLRDMLRREKTIVNTHAYIKLATSDLGQLLSGK